MQQKRNNNVFLLGMVSLFTDLSSQMIYPLVPVFLTSLGASNFLIGIIEGIAESTAALLRTIFGKLSDKFKNRKLFIYLGYGLSAISKPFLFFANVWTSVLAVRFFDRVGKAARTPARDALISTSVKASKKGSAFGFHRAMDRIGAAGGPILALLVLSLSNNNVRLVFLLSAIPALLALIFVFYVKETSEDLSGKNIPKTTGISLRNNKPFIFFLVSSIFFALGNSSNAFLILKAKETGLAIALIPVIWIVYNISSSFFSFVFGKLSDKVGRVPIIIVSFIYYAVLYSLFAITSSLWAIWILFIAYGLYYGLSEGIYRAYIADLTQPSIRATAYGIYNTAIGLALFPASLIMGTLWDMFNSQVAFFCSAGFSLIGFVIFLFCVISRKKEIKKT